METIKSLGALLVAIFQLCLALLVLVFCYQILTMDTSSGSLYSKGANDSLSEARIAFMNNDYDRACFKASLAASQALNSKDNVLYGKMLDTEKVYCKK
jgi:hypothetical protein